MRNVFVPLIIKVGEQVIQKSLQTPSTTISQPYTIDCHDNTSSSSNIVSMISWIELLNPRNHIANLSHHMVHDGQSGVRVQHSCETALNHMVHKRAMAIDKGLVNGVVLLNLRKEFDQVNYTVLLEKLTIYGCS